MDGIFSLPYSEFEAIHQIQKLFKKKKGYAVFIPVSRQQKGIDFIIMNTKSKKSLRVQVKSSRHWLGREKSKKAKEETLKYNFWFNNFLKRYKKGTADLYLLFGLYPIYEPGDNNIDSREIWKSIILAFTDNEMYKFLKKIKIKGERKEDRFFYIGFTSPSAIYITRGRPKQEKLPGHLLADRVKEIQAMLR